MSQTIDLGDLTPNDIGREVTIDTLGAKITGFLTGFDVDTAWITETQLCQHPDDARRTPGQKTMSISVGPWTTGQMPLGTKVEVAR